MKESSQDFDNALVDPVRWADERGIHGRLRWLRRHDPVRLVSPNGYDPFWAITRFADVHEIATNHVVFANDPRPTLSRAGYNAMMRRVTGRKHLIRSLPQMDDPEHAAYRSIIQGWFSGRNLAALQTRVEELATTAVDRLAGLGGECDFVKDVAAWYPLRVILSILGVPERDDALILKLTQELFGGTDPDIRQSFGLLDVLEVAAGFESYFSNLAQARRTTPESDLASVIANAKIDGRLPPIRDVSGFGTLIATAGHSTTTSSIAGGLLALLAYPDQMRRLRSNPVDILPLAVMEMVRWVSPVRHFMRTARADYGLRGKTIPTGESVALWYPSANRDEDIFEAPDEFRVDRSNAQSLAFGIGAHACLGQHLARAEMTAFYREFLRRVEWVELVGDPQHVRSIFVGGLKSLPIRYRMV